MFCSQIWGQDLVTTILTNPDIFVDAMKNSGYNPNLTLYIIVREFLKDPMLFSKTISDIITYPSYASKLYDFCDENRLKCLYGDT